MDVCHAAGLRAPRCLAAAPEGLCRCEGLPPRAHAWPGQTVSQERRRTDQLQQQLTGQQQHSEQLQQQVMQQQEQLQEQKKKSVQLEQQLQQQLAAASAGAGEAVELRGRVQALEGQVQQLLQALHNKV